jgi:hypothetical protein
MPCPNKYDILINQAKKVCNEPQNSSEIAKKLISIKKEIMSIKDKEEKKTKETLLENRELTEFLDNIINESEILMTMKSKKIKKELMLLILDDIICFICVIDDRNNIEEYYNIPLPNFTNFMFGSKRNFIVKSPVLYRCPYEKILILKDAIFLKECPFIFNIEEITDNKNIKNEFFKLAEKY